MRIQGSPDHLKKNNYLNFLKKGRGKITEHLERIFEGAEFDEVSVCRGFSHTVEDGKNYSIKRYKKRKAIIGLMLLALLLIYQTTAYASQD